MNTNTENLEAALAHWQRECLGNACYVQWVVATNDATRVATSDTAVMLTGCASILKMDTLPEAKDLADKLNSMPWDFDELELQVMPYHTLCRKQRQLYTSALQAARVADAMARSMVAA